MGDAVRGEPVSLTQAVDDAAVRGTAIPGALRRHRDHHPSPHRSPPGGPAGPAVRPPRPARIARARGLPALTAVRDLFAYREVGFPMSIVPVSMVAGGKRT